MRRHTMFIRTPFSCRGLVALIAADLAKTVPPASRMGMLSMPQRLSPHRCTPLHRSRLVCLVCYHGLLLVMALVLPITAFAATLPSGFQESVIFSGLTQPTAIRFARDGRVFVAEKSGLVKVFDNLSDTTPTIFADLRTNVHNFWDRGLLGLELDP